MASDFWGIDLIEGSRVALIGADGEVSYGALSARVAEMGARLEAGRGVIRLGAAPSVDSIAMYLAALQAGCPVLLADPKVEAQDERLPVLYRYDPFSDGLETNLDAAGLDLHPDLALLLSTSGSTGAQKFVRLSRHNLTSNAASIAQYLSLTQDDRAPTALPLSYSYGMSVLNSHLAVGASLVLSDAPVISDGFWTRFAETGCTSFSGVPQSFTLLAKGGQLARTYPKLRYVTQAGGKLGPDAVCDWASLGRQNGWDFFVMYGQTEAAPRIAYLPPQHALEHPQAIGHAIPGGTITVEDEAGPVAKGTEGELVYEGPNVMMGYASDPADLAKGDETTRLHTGDLGYQTEDDLFVITGRSSRFLKLSGKRISLEEIEVWMAKSGISGIATGADDALGLIHTDGPETLAKDAATFLGIPTSFVTEITVQTLPLNQNGKPDLKAAKAIFEAAKDTAPKGEMTDLQTLWGEILGLKTVPTDKSFYDLGGDSIAAFNAILKMEAMGLEADLVRGILNGKTIDDLSAPAARAEPTKGLNLTEMINAVHGLRGFLALWVVMVHWLPAVANRLNANTLYDTLYPAWRFGTPGFAMVFGIGIGALRMHQHQTLGAWNGAKLVVAGVIALALARLGTRLTDGEPWSKFDLSFLFHNAIFYYAIAMLTLPWLLRALAIGANRLLTIWLLCAAVMVVQVTLYVPIGLSKPDWAVLELIKVMTFGKFGVLRMTGYVLVGVAIGWLVRQHYARANFPRDMAFYGLAITVLGMMAQYQYSPDDLNAGFVLPKLWQVGLFAGVILMLLAGFTWIVRLSGPVGRHLRAATIVTGILAFPIFVGHQVVGEFKDLGDNLGLPGKLTLPLLLGLFLIGIGLAYKRMMRFYR